MPSANVVSDESNDKKYFIIVPQIVLALCRTPYDYTLWSVVKMIAGEYGECILSTPDLAKLSMMSVGKVSDSRAYLLATGLLEGKRYREPAYTQSVWHLRIPDIWLKNIEWRQIYDALKDRVELKERMRTLFDEADIFRRFNYENFKLMNSLQDINVKSLHNMKPSQYEKGISQYEKGISQNERKKNLKEKPKEKPQKRQGATSKKGTERPSIHIAVKTYQNIANRYPDKATWPMIEKTVGDKPDNLEFWSRVVIAYIACGWNKINISGMLTFFESRRIPTTEPIKGGIQNNGHSNNSTKRGSDLDSKPSVDPRTGAAVAPRLP